MFRRGDAMVCRFAKRVRASTGLRKLFHDEIPGDVTGAVLGLYDRRDPKEARRAESERIARLPAHVAGHKRAEVVSVRVEKAVAERHCD
jgi:hypothetical protein